MVRPTIRDDGETVILDLHGATIEEAHKLIHNTASLAHARGRSRLQIIHGTSTSSILERNRTIKYAIYDLIERGQLDKFVANEWRTEGHVLLGLKQTDKRDTAPIRMIDIQ